MNELAIAVGKFKISLADFSWMGNTVSTHNQIVSVTFGRVLSTVMLFEKAMSKQIDKQLQQENMNVFKILLSRVFEGRG